MYSENLNFVFYLSMHKIFCPSIAVNFQHFQVASLPRIPTLDSRDNPIDHNEKDGCMYILPECIASIKTNQLNKDDTKSLNNEKFQYNEEINILFMPVLQKTSIRFFKRFPTAMHSDKMCILHLFGYSQWSIFISTLYRVTIAITYCINLTARIASN